MVWSTKWVLSFSVVAAEASFDTSFKIEGLRREMGGASSVPSLFGFMSWALISSVELWAVDFVVDVFLWGLKLLMPSSVFLLIDVAGIGNFCCWWVVCVVGVDFVVCVVDG
ncbi:hypothetical protein C2G38_2028586 [Gigaspora rosea]|uniref:Transmembrane protein n=1 Tax=Gigaspora rosea TaxID=44941 RepID=A0A397WA03_9GLOM|nr:hypothetical protein C2G38_2028586 [Gigaspora rosea]